ncbi:PP2C family protein-serine/threonine phosphatase [Streptomyces sp. Ncost-T10-10d]|uniref:PP2C family protein-serine/threonine phosphatase n=1 Tax=Streptomyces sp. Ncost-T10-10d TaxID=1839774 RepID=UPI000B85A490|nr:PP2C family protein-serine/threonine phosphatase [Streptomyces sp. Ncost-T10-10d]
MLAGRPSLAEIAQVLKGAGISRSTIHDAFCSQRLPKWKVIDALVEVLSSKAPGGRPEEDQKVLYEVWLRAAQESDGQQNQGPQTSRERKAEIHELLQRALLPQKIPQIDGLEIASRYLPASDPRRAGGDWFDVIPLEGAKVALAAGDVMGGSMLSIALMAQLRSELNALVQLSLPPHEALNRLSEQAQRLMGDQLATCVCAVYETDTRLLSISSAGHIPPFLLRRDGTGFILDMPTGIPIGLAADACETITVQMNPGDTLFFLTDGVIVSPTEGLDPGLARLATSLSEAQTAADPTLPSLEDLIDVPLKALGNLRHDDAVLLAARLS